jgi:hypothetical protein
MNVGAVKDPTIYVLPFFQKLPPCLIGIEACASSHHWSRELQALGHTVRLMPPAYVKPYVKRQKNDATDAEAICEAVTRANMRFVPTKTPEQQSCLMLHRTRHLFIRQQTAVINAIRAHLAEFGIVAPVGRNGVEQLLNIVADSTDKRLPDVARVCIAALGAQLRTLKVQILNFDRQIMAWHQRPFVPGQSGNPGGRPKDVHGIRQLSLDEGEASIATLVNVRDTDESGSNRIKAAIAILDRGCGKPTPPADGRVDVQWIVRDKPMSEDEWRRTYVDK